MKRPPIISNELIAYLQSVYPERSPDPQDSDREIWMKAGASRVIRDLVDLKRVQEENPEDFMHNVYSEA